jgi:hypothetical protein
MLDIVNSVRYALKLALITVRRLQADVMLGIRPVEADVGRILTVRERVHVQSPSVLPLVRDMHAGALRKQYR